MNEINIINSHVLIQVNDFRSDAEEIENEVVGFKQIIEENDKKEVLGPEDAENLLTVQDNLLSTLVNLEKLTNEFQLLVSSKPFVDLELKLEDEAIQSSIDSDDSSQDGDIKIQDTRNRIEIVLNQGVDKYGMDPFIQNALYKKRVDMQAEYLRLLNMLESTKAELNVAREKNQDLYESIASKNNEPFYQCKMKITKHLSLDEVEQRPIKNVCSHHGDVKMCRCNMTKRRY